MLDSLDLNKYNAALSRGLCQGKGKQDGQMCIEAAICYALGLSHGDDPQCVSEAVRSFKINLNDSDWSSPEARANGLRDLGLAQLGSLGVVDDKKFTQQLALATINKLIPALYRELFPNNAELLELALQCENAIDLETARVAADAAVYATRNAAQYSAYAAAKAAAYTDTARYASAYTDAARYTAYSAARAADAARDAADAAYYADAATNPDKYLIMSANLALDVLKELGSPGCKFLS